MKKLMAAMTLSFTLVGCATSQDDPNRKTKQGAVTGAAAGAVVGGVIGHQSGNRNTGAAVGAVVGAGVGAAIGRRMDQQQKELQQIEGVEVTRTAEDELNVSLRNDVLFDFNSSRLRAESRQSLNDMSEVFERYTDTTIVVEGHADSIGSDSYNQTLSEERAQTVADYIIGQGVRSSRVVARGFGETRPKTSNDTAEGRQLNRRVEIHVKANPEAASE